jgi:hypothetical protein
MLRTTPPIIKIYEALGAISDQRIELTQGLFVEAKVYSSSREKYYTVTYDPANNSIMLNDNGSYWKGYLGYPGIAVLLLTGVLPLQKEYSEILKDIPRKEINTKNNNDFEKTQKQIDTIIIEKWWDIQSFHKYIQNIIDEITKKPLSYLGKKTLPPKGN